MFRPFILLLILFSACRSSQVVSDHYAQADRFQLVAPQVSSQAFFFKGSTQVMLELDFPDADIYYSLDGNAVSRRSTAYQRPINIQHSCILQTKAFHPDCQSSETVQRSFFKVTDLLDGIEMAIHPSLDRRYPGEGISSLTDLQKGTNRFRDDKRWLGFQKDTIDFILRFQVPTKIPFLSVSTFVNEISWIFMPRRIEILANHKTISTWRKKDYDLPAKTGFHFLTLSMPDVSLNEFTLRVFADPLPKGHRGYGYISWFFIDEIFSSY